MGYIEREDAQGPLPEFRVFSYTVDGVEYNLKTGERSKEASSIGESCTIWYNPKKPQDAEVFRGSDEYLKKLLIIGIVLVLVGIVMFFIGLSM